MDDAELEAVRKRRATALAGHTGDAESARVALADEDAAVRAAALGALQRLDQLDDETLRRFLADPSSKVRHAAATIGARHKDVDLLDLLHDDETSVIEVSAWAIGEQEQPTDGVIDALSDIATNHEDALCRESAVAALGALQDERALPVILKATTDKPAVRRRAIIALSPFEGPEVTKALEKALEDRDWQVRQAAEDQLR